MNDWELVKGIAAGNAEAAEAFVQAHYLAVFRLLLRLTGKREEAEDLTQQTFISIRQKISSFRGASSLRTWVHRVAFNEYKQWKRRKRPETPLKAEFARTAVGFQIFEDGHVLTGAIAQLSDKLREAFILHEVEELSIKEVAQVLGIPSGTVKARVHYARHQLRQLLSDPESNSTTQLAEAKCDATQ